MSDSYDFDIFTVLEFYGWDLPSPRGHWQSVKCGAHDDSHASCRISADANYVKCLACDFHGDALDAIAHYEKGLTFGECVRRAEEITGTSSDSVRASDRRRGGVSRRQGSDPGGRRYTPPRVRRRSGDRP